MGIVYVLHYITSFVFFILLKIDTTFYFLPPDKRFDDVIGSKQHSELGLKARVILCCFQVTIDLKDSKSVYFWRDDKTALVSLSLHRIKHPCFSVLNELEVSIFVRKINPLGAAFMDVLAQKLIIHKVISNLYRDVI